MPTIDPDKMFRKAQLVYPQPVAIAAGKLIRCRTPQERVDACLKAAEATARYLAALALASFHARDLAEGSQDLKLEPLHGALSFGAFLSAVQRIAGLDAGHPLRDYLSPFRATKKGVGPADECLTALLNLRNDLGHDLASLSEARARSILAQDEPESKLARALASIEGILTCPLFLIEDQQLARAVIRARRLWLMGESRDPEPEELTLREGVYELRRPYVAVGAEVLPLWPCLVWEILPQQHYGLLLFDTVKDGQVVCQSMDAVERAINTDAVVTLRDICTGQPRPAETVGLPGGGHLRTLWVEEKQLRLDAGERQEGAIPWGEFDHDTLEWYAARLGRQPAASVRDTIVAALFDGRTRFMQDEIRQARLLFGTESVVRSTVMREMIDLRRVTDPTQRWDDRRLKCANVLVCMRLSVDFFVQHVGLQETSIDGLNQTTGSADYLAMRESLVNLFIHQDYADASAAAQIELRPEAAVFFNAGFSLVVGEKLVEGGKSQARNPVIARALRLIGFAELAGSGIRVMQGAWRQARRRPPRFESDRVANTFTLTLDWRLVIDAYDQFWKKRLGVKVTAEQAQILNLALTADGLSIEEAASGTGLTVEDARVAVRYLIMQALLDERQGRYYIKDHLKELAQ